MAPQAAHLRQTRLDNILAPERIHPAARYAINAIDNASKGTGNGSGRIGIVAKVDSRQHALRVARRVGKAPKRRFVRMEDISARTDRATWFPCVNAAHGHGIANRHATDKRVGNVHYSHARLG